MKSLRLSATILLLGLPSLAVAQQGTVGTLIVAHGGGPAWDAQVETIADQVETGGPVGVSFLMGPGASEHRFQEVARKLVDEGADRIVVVPMLVSSHSGHYEEIRWLAGETDEVPMMMLEALRMAGIEPADVDVPVEVTPALDDSPEMADVLAERALALTDDPRGQALYLMGHGPNGAEDYAAWMANLRPVAERVKELTGFRDVKVGLVRDDAPDPVRREAVAAIRETIALQNELTQRPVVVVPVLISTGQVSRERFPADLAGLPVIYSGDALLPHPGMANVVEARVRAAQAGRE